MALDYYKDIEDGYGAILVAAYEKANIWPLENADKGLEILEEEIKEAHAAGNELVAYYMQGFAEDKDKDADYACHYLEGLAMSTISELLQVIAVCRKYKPVFVEAEKHE